MIKIENNEIWSKLKKVTAIPYPTITNFLLSLPKIPPTTVPSTLLPYK